LIIIFKCFEKPRVSEHLINSVLLHFLNSIPFRLHFSLLATFKIAPVVYTLCEFPLRFEMSENRVVPGMSGLVGWLAGWLAGFADDVSFSLPEIN